jgi:hypothetical protein
VVLVVVDVDVVVTVEVVVVVTVDVVVEVEVEVEVVVVVVEVIRVPRQVVPRHISFSVEPLLSSQGVPKGCAGVEQTPVAGSQEPCW